MSSNNIPDIEKIETLQAGQSQYVNPIRIHYTQSGKKKIWDCMKCHDSVSIIIYNKIRSVLVFVKQLRPAVLLASRLEDPTSKDMKNSSVTGYTLELCAGILDKERKTPAEVAQEEVLEETGYQVPVGSLKFLSSFRSGVGVTGSLQQLFFCEVEDSQRVSKGGGIGDEQIEVLELGVDEAFEKLWVRDEDCSESRPASMLFALSWFFYEYAPKNNIKMN